MPGVGREQESSAWEELEEGIEGNIICFDLLKVSKNNFKVCRKGIANNR